MAFGKFLSVYCKFSALEFGVVLILMSAEAQCSLSSSAGSKHSKNEREANQIDSDVHHNNLHEEMMDSKFDFNFKWDEEPPEFISQLDLEVKWEDGEGGTESTPSRVSIRNVTMDHDYDITIPMTKLITSVASKSLGNVQNEVHPSHEQKKDTGFSKNSVLSQTTGVKSCSCEDLDSLIKSVQILKGKRGKRGIKGNKGDPGLSIVGPKGEPGHPGLLPYHLLHPENVKGERGEPGPRGPPGQCSAQCRNTGSTVAETGPSKLQSGSSINQGPLPKPNYRIVPGALVFKSFPTMVQVVTSAKETAISLANGMSAYVMIGSVAFVEDSDEFYGKVKKGWRKFLMEPFH